MRILTVAVGCFLWASLSYGECVTVTPIITTTFQVSPDIVITATLDGKRASTVSIEVLTAFNEPRFSLVTDERGIAAIPMLSPGSYHVVAVARTQPLGELYLAELSFDVSMKLEQGPSLLAVDLVSANRFWPRELPVDESTAPRGKPLAIGAVERFRGSVIDPTGSPISGATIHVFKQESPAQALVTEIRADESGRFSAPLEPGSYRASVKMQGFRTRQIVFEIAPYAGAKNLEISLNIGGC